MCRSSSHIDSRTVLRKAHSLLRVAPYGVSHVGIALQSELVRIRRSYPGTALEAGLPACYWRVISERSAPPRTATTLRSTEPGRHTYGSAGPVSRSALLRFALPPPSRAALPSRAAPESPRYSLHLGIPIPAAPRIRASSRIRSTLPSGWQSCGSPCVDPKNRGRKWRLFFSCLISFRAPGDPESFSVLPATAAV